MIACRKQFTDTLLELAREDKDIIAVTTDARGSVTLGDYANALPEQFVECGIAEQDAVGISAGLAHSGKKVFCCGPACFYVARSLEQVKVDLAYSENPVTIPLPFWVYQVVWLMVPWVLPTILCTTSLCCALSLA